MSYIEIQKSLNGSGSPWKSGTSKSRRELNLVKKNKTIINVWIRKNIRILGVRHRGDKYIVGKGD